MDAYSSSHDDYGTSLAGLTSSAGCVPTQSNHAKANWGINIDGCSSITPEFSRHDYEYWRPHDAMPVDHCAIMLECLMAYEMVGPVRNVIDIMSDFASAGVKITHPNSSIERFYKNWFNRVNGVDLSERILSNLFKFATAIIRRRETKITRKKERMLKRAVAEDFVDPEARRKVIPSGYKLLNPCMIDVIGGPLTAFTGELPVYGIKLPIRLIEMIRAPFGDVEKRIVAQLPADIKKAADNGLNAVKVVEMNNDNLSVLHYKKDDWQNWAKPIIYSVLYDIKLLYKLKLADFSVLDSALDMVRIYKIGNMEHKILPNEPAFAKLRDALLENNTGGIRNLVWGPDIELVESKNDGFDILGPKKYQAVWDSIHSGLGIPPSVTGTSEGGTTNNLISLKVLIKRLSYGRQKLIHFWTQEIERVQQAMGFRVPAQIEFDFMNLGDEEAEKRLWIELADRDIVSTEWVQNKLGANSVIEKNRLNKEHRERINKKRVPKAGPWHDPEWEKKIKRVLLEEGRVTPDQIGVEIEGELMEGNEPRNKNDNNNDDEKLRQPSGRPPGKKDDLPRKRRRFKPQIKATNIWLKTAQSFISKHVNPIILSSVSKSNMRKLSSEETKNSEDIKFSVLLCLSPMTELTKEAIGKVIKTPLLNDAIQEYHRRINELELEVGGKLSSEDRLEIQRDMYMEVYSIE